MSSVASFSGWIEQRQNYPKKSIPKAVEAKEETEKTHAELQPMVGGGSVTGRDEASRGSQHKGNIHLGNEFSSPPSVPPYRPFAPVCFSMQRALVMGARGLGDAWLLGPLGLEDMPSREGVMGMQLGVGFDGVRGVLTDGPKSSQRHVWSCQVCV